MASVPSSTQQSEYVPLPDDMNVDDTQVPLARVDYRWDSEAIPSFDAPICPVREPTPGSSSHSRTPAPQVGVRTQSKRRRSATTVQSLEPTELVQSLISTFNAQGASSTSASNDEPSTEVAKVLKDMVSSYEIDNTLFFKSLKFLGGKDEHSYKLMFLALEPEQRTNLLEAILSVNIPTESAEGVNIPKDSEFETESAQAGLGVQPPLPNIYPNFDENIPIFGGNSEGEEATTNNDVGYSDKSLLRSFRFYRARSIALGQDLNAFKSLKARGTRNSLSLKKLKEHYAYKLEKVLSDGTAAAAKKKKGLTTRSVARTYMLYVLGSFLFPTKKRTNVSARYLVLFAKDKVVKKWSWGSAVLAHMYYNLGAASRDDARQFVCCTTLLELGGIPKEMDSDVYEHCTYWKWDVSVTNKYGVTALLNFREALDNYKLEDVVWDPYTDKRDSLHAFKEVTFFYGALASPDHVQPYYPNRVVQQFNREQGIPTNQKWKEFVLKKADRGRRVRERPLVCTKAYLEWFASVLWTTICPITVDLAVDDSGIHQRKTASVNEHGDTPVHQYEDIAEQYDASHHEHSSLSPNINLNDHQITTLNDQLHKLKEDKEESEANNNLREAIKENVSHTLSLVVHNEVWLQALKKALASEGIRDMGDPTFEELFEHNERFFTIA
ncbi:hypothetical protein GIB67_038643 [Kingdonia uniflora]|uniref:Aminotransferase-like plant mobile domain-containing protein n=1 Tax=Kingdonia uniflora TaxID=39325 RepID=A0A7J7NPP8_9MAGN|nr:hypothetical protein GIB67_038643 [Kingdonia uniflora]